MPGSLEAELSLHPARTFGSIHLSRTGDFLPHRSQEQVVPKVDAHPSVSGLDLTAKTCRKSALALDLQKGGLYASG